MSMEVRLVLRVVVVCVDLKRVAFDNRTQQIEAGFLIPPAAFIEINERKESNGAEQERGSAREGE